MTWRVPAVALCAAGAFGLSACSSSSAPPANQAYGPSGAQFTVSFPSSPSTGATPSSVTSNFTGVTKGTDYWTGPSQDPQASSGNTSPVGSQYVTVLQFDNSSDASQAYDAIKGQSGATPMSSVNGNSSAQGVQFSDSTSEAEFITLGSTIWEVDSVASSQSDRQSFINSFTLQSGDTGS